MGILTNTIANEVAGLIAWKPPVDVAATSNIASLSGLQTIDGVTGVEGLGVLLTAQSTGAQNGVYLMSTGSWVRRGDMDASAECVIGTTWRVTRGTAGAGRTYTLTGPVGSVITLGTTALTVAESPLSGGGGFSFESGSPRRIVVTTDLEIKATGAGSDISALADGDTVTLEAGPSAPTKTTLVVRRADDVTFGQEYALIGGIFKRRRFLPPDVTTTDATVTTLWSLTLSDNTTYHIRATVTADQTSGASSASYERVLTVKRAGGVATIVGAVSTPHTAEDVAGWDCTLDVDGSNAARVRVTGAAATTVVWAGDITVNAKGF